MEGEEHLHVSGFLVHEKSRFDLPVAMNFFPFFFSLNIFSQLKPTAQSF